MNFGQLETASVAVAMETTLTGLLAFLATVICSYISLTITSNLASYAIP